MQTGTITAIKNDKGYGFVRPDDGSEDLFFHISGSSFAPTDFTASLVQLAVAFDVGTDERSGRVRAINVRPVR